MAATTSSSTIRLTPPPCGPATLRDSTIAGDYDPLSEAAKSKIFKFTKDACSGVVLRWIVSSSDPWNAIKGDKGDFQPLSELGTTEHKFKFSFFQIALKDPRSLASTLGIDPGSKSQIAAARIFLRLSLKVMMTDPLFTAVSCKAVDRVYKQKITGLSKGVLTAPCGLSPKYKLLFEDDPVKPLTSSEIPSSIDTILSRIYFMSPAGEERETTRAKIIRSIERLATLPQAKHVIEALACLLRNGRGRFFVGDESSCIGKIGKADYFPDDLRKVGGFTLCQSIFVPAFDEDPDSKEGRDSLAIFMHESLHFIFRSLMKNESDPIFSSLVASVEAKTLDEALAKDRAYRTSLGERGKHISSMWRLMVDELENNFFYFSEPFDSKNLNHLKIMRLEAIVRVMHTLVSKDETEDYVEAVAPHLYSFYREYSHPLMESYTLYQNALAKRTPLTNDELKTIWNFLKRSPQGKLFKDLLNSIERKKGCGVTHCLRRFKILSDHLRAIITDKVSEKGIITDPIALCKYLTDLERFHILGRSASD